MDFDPTPYLSLPRLEPASAVALSIALLHSLAVFGERGAPPPVLRAAVAMRSSTLALQESWAARDAAALASRPTDAKVADHLVDTAWAALRQRLEGYSSLPPSRHPSARRAAEICSTIFPDGLAFLMLAYKKEWAHSEEILRRIDSDGLAEDIDRLAGPEFLAEVRLAHDDYGKALNIGESGPGAGVTVVEPLRALARAISHYSLRVVSLAEPDEVESIELVKRALRPIDLLRDHQAKSAARGMTAPPPGNIAPTTPIPEIPEAAISHSG